jgi:hypothetical protein
MRLLGLIAASLLWGLLRQNSATVSGERRPTLLFLLLLLQSREPCPQTVGLLGQALAPLP